MNWTSWLLVGMLMAVMALGVETPAMAGDNPEAIYAKGMSYYRDYPPDYAQAMLWLEHAANLGHADAMFTLGKMYYKGLGVKRDNAQALAWFERAAQKGHPASMFLLGDMLGRRLTGEDRLGEARMWLEKAAEKRIPDAALRLGDMMAEGQGGPVDLAAAIRYYQQAANLGHPTGMINLARMYESGRGTGVNLKMATVWTLIASKADARYKGYAGMLLPKLSPAEQKEVQASAERIYGSIQTYTPYRPVSFP